MQVYWILDSDEAGSAWSCNFADLDGGETHIFNLG